ncbi:RNA 2',3'-cyclic phosphodiesterase [uncultured Pseudodesulfovibrio sp.]|uniref:RNA 2',3'-cyclic phosphodiesterase n=1 Tax=uncultured Pseudodesulfovibrio sp. TaxID=2035858 RepID=UPI0029C77AFF|nr:RNA 2',3'-cyclic phosphodiesterase [uncultured Pseudodesulfovibrio sp.]
MPRLFIGLGLPETYQQSVTPFTDGLNAGLDASVRWMRPGNWHLTLKFLGDIDEDMIPAIVETLSSITFREFPMQAGDSGAFPGVKRPRVIWLGLKQGAQQCADLAEVIEEAMADIGIGREKKRFRPHLTIGWVKRPGQDDWKAVLARANQDWPEFTAKRFTLWQSELNPTGAVHTVLHDFSLKAD